MYHQALMYLAWERPESAERLLTEVLEHGRAIWGVEGGPTLNVMRNLARAHEAQGQYSKAEPLRTQVLRAVRRKVGADHADAIAAAVTLSANLLHLRRYAEAEPHLREVLAVRTKKEPDAWATFNTRSMLGGALLGQKQYAEAEPLLVEGYKGMKAREKTIPQSGGGELRIPEALDRLIELYTATDKPDEAAKWRAERAKHPFIAPPPRLGR